MSGPGKLVAHGLGNDYYADGWFEEA
jgi:hypothetical protein